MTDAEREEKAAQLDELAADVREGRAQSCRISYDPASSGEKVTVEVQLVPVRAA